MKDPCLWWGTLEERQAGTGGPSPNGKLPFKAKRLHSVTLGFTSARALSLPTGRTFQVWCDRKGGFYRGHSYNSFFPLHIHSIQWVLSSSFYLFIYLFIYLMEREREITSGQREKGKTLGESELQIWSLCCLVTDLTESFTRRKVSN